MENGKHTRGKLYLPYIGQRILKTSFAVFLCLVFYYYRGYRGAAMSAEAAITAIICMQPYVHDTREYSLNRVAGTLIGAMWGFLFLLIVPLFPSVTGIPLYALMGVGTLISLYSGVVIRKPDTSSLAAIVFVCVVIVYPDVEHPLDQAFHRVLDVLVGTGIAIGVNVFRLPRMKLRDRLLFVRTKDLAPDQLAQIPSTVLFRLNYLNGDGANICLISEHAPAFFMGQISQIHMNAPMIVMDGAAIFDANENTYLSTVPVPPAASEWLMGELKRMGISFFIYTVHRNRSCIYHHGAMSKEEKTVFQHMKRSPYRQYLDDDEYSPEDIVYLKVVARKERVHGVLNEVQGMLGSRGIRAALRPQAGLPEGASLYFYSIRADAAHAEKEVLRRMNTKHVHLKPREIFSAKEYRSEHDAVHLLHRLSNAYEPLKIVWWFRQHSGKGQKKK